MPGKFLLRALIFGALQWGTAHALEWKSKVFEVTTAPFQSTVEAAFEFRNASAKPVAILAVDTSCDCVTAASDHSTFQPGETGRIQSIFTIGDRVGYYERTILVKTDENAANPVRLILRVTVPDLVTIVPRMIYWRTGETATEKTLEITVAPTVALKLEDVQSMTQSFAVRLETITPGRNYRLHITPHSTVQSASDAFRIHGTTHDGRSLVFSAYAYVK